MSIRTERRPANEQHRRTPKLSVKSMRCRACFDQLAASFRRDTQLYFLGYIPTHSALQLAKHEAFNCGGRNLHPSLSTQAE